MTVALDAGRTKTQGRELPPSMVERMTLILDAFDQPTSVLTLEDVARATHLPRSTAHRILHQLVGLEWLDHTSNGYRLGRRALGAGVRESGHSELRAAAAPHLHELLMRTGAVVHLAVLEDGKVSYLDKVGGSFARTVPSRVGGVQPAYCTALGKAMLAWHEPSDVDMLVGGDLSPRTAATIANLEALHADLHRIRARGGLAFERGEAFQGLACAAAAIMGPDGPVGALSAVVPAEKPLERVAPLVVHAAREISLELFGELPTRKRRLRSVAAV
ncbi:MAG: IclR family transcriptional regulator [Nocardioides sp.]|uniref:IclR family transcriptional regulator n=1 Tax=Nocardioides sp. TaxID=35761 RepID=UPI003F0AF73D